VGPKAAGLDVMEKRKLSYPCKNYNPRSSRPQPSHYINYATPTTLTYISLYIIRRCLVNCTVHQVATTPMPLTWEVEWFMLQRTVFINKITML
jgi:hypothetical protein